MDISSFNQNSIKGPASETGESETSGAFKGELGAGEPEKRTGLLFYLSGDQGSRADVAQGDPEAVFFHQVEIREKGPWGKYFACGNTQLMAYKAPGNVYAERGTISFFWMSEMDLGLTPFPIFRVTFADHSSWDHIFLRIDYNGQKQGFDAFVTDIGNSRIRVSSTMHPYLKKGEWVHLAFSWDETVGVKLYINGLLVEQKLEKRVLAAGLDKLGPHSRNISSWGVQSAFNFIRGGCLDELRIYDRMLEEDEILALSKNQEPALAPFKRSLKDPDFWQEWLRQNGWDSPHDQPAYREGDLSVRKVQIQEAFEHGLWSYKAMDGIRETAWPNTFNRSRLPGRNDYFQLPDWNCYYDSGTYLELKVPEKWNQLEISGSAFGKLYRLQEGKKELVEDRKRYQERSVHYSQEIQEPGTLRFENTLIEETIRDFSPFYVTQGQAPEGSRRETFYLQAGLPQNLTEREKRIRAFLQDRYPEDERNMAWARPERSTEKVVPEKKEGLPVVNLILPYDPDIQDGLDGVELTIPALSLQDSPEGFVSLRVEVKDPLWMYRNLCDFSFRVKIGEAKKVWLDLRDRILPKDRAMWISIAASSADFTKEALENMAVTLVYKPREEALKEHIEDRFNQVRDNYGNLVEEAPAGPQFNMFVRFCQDCLDILKYCPDHELAKQYWWDGTRKICGNAKYAYSPWSKTEGFCMGYPIREPEFKMPKVPEGVAPWAFYQVEMIKRFKYVTDWWIQHRMIEDGEIGGGLSDDGDQMQTWVALAHMGFEPEKYRETHFRQMEAYYDQGMFVDGLAMIATDGLHSYEDGIQMLTQCTQFEPWNPKHFERALETTRGVYRVTDYTPRGERWFRSIFYSGAYVSTDQPWNRGESVSALVAGPAVNIAKFSGNKAAVKLNLELAETYMNHYKDGVMRACIDFKTGEDSTNFHYNWCNQLLLAHELTKDDRFLQPVRSNNGKPAPYAINPREETMDLSALAEKNLQEDKKMFFREYINTLGYTWSDRLDINTLDAQMQRLGGVVSERNHQFSTNPISWCFEEEQDALKVGILVLYSSSTRVKILVFNMKPLTVKAWVLGNSVDPGTWQVVSGLDRTGSQNPEEGVEKRSCYFENYLGIPFEFPPMATTVMELTLVVPGIPYHERPELGMTREDVRLEGDRLVVTVHSMGSVDAPETDLALYGPQGDLLESVKVPALKALNDLYPKRAKVSLKAPRGLSGCTLLLDPDRRLFEITRVNNQVAL